MIMLKHSEQLARHYVGSLISSKVSETKAPKPFRMSRYSIALCELK